MDYIPVRLGQTPTETAIKNVPTLQTVKFGPKTALPIVFVKMDMSRTKMQIIHIQTAVLQASINPVYAPALAHSVLWSPQQIAFGKDAQKH